MPVKATKDKYKLQSLLLKVFHAIPVIKVLSVLVKRFQYLLFVYIIHNPLFAYFVSTVKSMLFVEFINLK